MERLIKQVTESLEKAGLVEIEVSARHVHLTAEDVEALFGKGAVLHPKRPLSQKGQFLSEERVTLVGKKRKMEPVPGKNRRRRRRKRRRSPAGKQRSAPVRRM